MKTIAITKPTRFVFIENVHYQEYHAHAILVTHLKPQMSISIGKTCHE